jgi:hypothetical protein
VAADRKHGIHTRKFTNLSKGACPSHLKAMHPALSRSTNLMEKAIIDGIIENDPTFIEDIDELSISCETVETDYDCRSESSLDDDLDELSILQDKVS